MKTKMIVALALLATSVSVEAKDTVNDLLAERCAALQRLATTVHQKRGEGVEKYEALEVVDTQHDGIGGEAVRDAKKAAKAVVQLVYADYSAQEIGNLCRD